MLFVVAGAAGSPDERAHGSRQRRATSERPAPRAGAPIDATDGAAEQGLWAETATRKTPARRRQTTGTPDRVVRVTDGDTVVLKRLGKARLVGIDTPEVFGTHECYGRRASAFTKRLLAPGSRVTYRFAVERRDRYGRALVYMWKGKTFANAELVRRGYAVTLIVPPNVRYAERFRALAAKARAANRGLWSPSTCNGNDDKSPTRPHGSDTLSAGNKTEPRRSAPLSRHDHASRDKDCSDFSSHAQAQKYFEAHGGPASDPDRLDADHDGIACESGASTSGRKPPPSGSSSSDGRDGAGDDLDLSGDKDCSDFSSHAQAQKYFEAKGGPRSDPDRLDADHDGTACDSL